MDSTVSLVWFRRLALAGALLAATVIVLGAWVRLTDAGLGCPDWPGCYGQLYPRAAHSVGKAWHEMIHRYVAGSLGLVIVALLGWAIIGRKHRGQPLAPVALLFAVVCLQGALGALTVTKLLKPLIVTAHLLGGLSTLGLLCWLAMETESSTANMRGTRLTANALRRAVLAALVVLTVQIFLGGWTSTNYAAIACPDLPTCQRSWWPAMDFHDAFILWRGVPVDYEGGILSNAARTAIHFSHRVGAALTGSLLLIVGAMAIRNGGITARAGMLVMAAVLLQISLGVATVRFGFPLPLAVMHNAGAALLVVSVVRLLKITWTASESASRSAAVSRHARLAA